MGDEIKEGKNADCPSDEALMRAYVQGDYGAFEVLYKRHSKTVYGFLRKKLKSDEMVKDVFQATFLQLHRSRAKYDSALPFLPWLFALCRNSLTDNIRLQRRMQEEPSENIAEISEAHYLTSRESSNSQSTLNINEWGQVLSVKEREVLSLRFTEDFSFEEIATRLRIKPAGARKISQRALQKLKSIWK